MAESTRDVSRIRAALSVAALALALTPVAWRLLFARDTTTPRARGEVVLSYMAWGNPQQLDVERQLVRRFNEQCAARGQRVRVELSMPPAGGYVQKLQLMLASNTAPDLMRCDQYYFPAHAQRGYFHDLTALAANDPEFKRSDFAESAIRECTLRGKLYAVNVIFGGVVVYYNKDLFARAGLHDPYDLWKAGQWTWDAFDDASIRLTQSDARGRPSVYGFLVSPSAGAPQPWIWQIWLWREGAALLNADRSHCPIDTPSGIRALERIHDMIHKTRVSPPTGEATGSAFGFESGNIAMEMGWIGLAPRYRDNIRDFRWDIAPLPQHPDPARQFTMVKGNQLVMSANCPHPIEAWSFMKFMVSEQTETLLNGDALRRGVPTRKAVLESPAFLNATIAPFHTDVFRHLYVHPRELPIDGAWYAWISVANRHLARYFLDPAGDAHAIAPVVVQAIDFELARQREILQRYDEVNIEPATKSNNIGGNGVRP